MTPRNSCGLLFGPQKLSVHPCNPRNFSPLFCSTIIVSAGFLSQLVFKVKLNLPTATCELDRLPSVPRWTDFWHQCFCCRFIYSKAIRRKVSPIPAAACSFFFLFNFLQRKQKAANMCLCKLQRFDYSAAGVYTQSDHVHS